MQKINRVLPENNQYLQILHSVDKTIKCLYYIGNLPAERRPTVAIVGTRKPTNYGNEIAYRLAYDLASKGVVIVSGLALGIDAVAHRGALDAGGTTIAVLGSGVDVISPQSHRALGERIINSGGAILSEYEPGVAAQKYTFLERNRIVSGLSEALIIVEAAQRSGTLNTASHALSQGKLVAAVPGNITSYASAGCNKLLQQGALLVTSADDILNELGIMKAPKTKQLVFGDNDDEESIIALLRNGVRDGAQLQQDSGLSAAAYNQSLTMLEIKGVVQSHGANNWSLR